jgi:hypothetical protein
VSNIGDDGKPSPILRALHDEAKLSRLHPKGGAAAGRIEHDGLSPPRATFEYIEQLPTPTTRRGVGKLERCERRYTQKRNAVDVDPLAKTSPQEMALDLPLGSRSPGFAHAGPTARPRTSFPAGPSIDERFPVGLVGVGLLWRGSGNQTELVQRPKVGDDIATEHV